MPVKLTCTSCSRLFQETVGCLAECRENPIVGARAMHAQGVDLGACDRSSCSNSNGRAGSSSRCRAVYSLPSGHDSHHSFPAACKTRYRTYPNLRANDQGLNQAWTWPVPRDWPVRRGLAIYHSSLISCAGLQYARPAHLYPRARLPRSPTSPISTTINRAPLASRRSGPSATCPPWLSCSYTSDHCPAPHPRRRLQSLAWVSYGLSRSAARSAARMTRPAGCCKAADRDHEDLPDTWLNCSIDAAASIDDTDCDAKPRGADADSGEISAGVDWYETCCLATGDSSTLATPRDAGEADSDEDFPILAFAAETFPSAALQQAAALLRCRLPVAIPTETVYGLAANALSAEAVGRIFAAKGRPADNPLIVHVSSLAMLHDLYPTGWVLPTQVRGFLWTSWLIPVVIPKAMPGDLVMVRLPLTWWQQSLLAARIGRIACSEPHALTPFQLPDCPEADSLCPYLKDQRQLPKSRHGHISL